MAPFVSDVWLNEREREHRRDAWLFLGATYTMLALSASGLPMGFFALMPLTLAMQHAGKLRAIRNIRARAPQEPGG